MQKPVMYIIANKGLGMSPGKLAAQVAHAAVRSAWNDEHANVKEWLSKGETKIVLEARDTEHLMTAERYLGEHGVVTHLVIDEGRTEIPAHSPTALASQIVDKDDEAIRFAFGDFRTYRETPDLIPILPHPLDMDKASVLQDSWWHRNFPDLFGR